MHKKQIVIDVLEYTNNKNLPTADQTLIQAAQQALQNSYAPYSKFHVGAAVLLQNNEIITGSNQENAAYPSGLCAERVALFYANAQYPNIPVLSIAIAAKTNGKLIPQPLPPCGACRQVIQESQARYQHPIRLIMAGTQKIQIIENSEHLLPLHFDASWLE